ncbi:MAG: hypothetical protein KBB55_00260 [Candidatus Buchananbacteria bacterium]|nr:hypothetical protein [Candidatus Buchananbacteria bacterium]
MKKLHKQLLAGIMTLTLALAFAAPVAFAQNDDPFGVNNASFENTLQGSSDNADLMGLITKIMQWIFSFLGIVAVLVILYGGFKWMTAGGDDGKVSEAKKLIVNGIIGLIIILSAYAIATFVFNEVNNRLLNDL